MKRVTLFLRLCIILIIVSSCSNDDDASNNNSNESISNNFPLSIGNYWNYSVENRNVVLNEIVNRTDSLYVASGNANSFNLSVNGIAFGTMNTILTQTSLSKTSNKLLANGVVSFPFDGLNDLEIPVENAIFYDINAADNSTLTESSGFISETVENIPITVNYSFKTLQGEFFDSILLNSEIYDNVIFSKIVLQLTITTRIEIIPGSEIEVTILDTQNVLEIDNYYAENIGLVRSEADISYQLEDFSQVGITLPFENIEATSIQELDTYEVAPE